jgi:hypothetical protein
LTTLMVAVVASACGSSSQTESITAPSSTKCPLQLSADSPSVPAAGGSGLLRITTNRECQWAAKTDATWLTIASPAEGQGDGSVRFSASANTDPGSRTGAITVNDQRLEISQIGKPCELTVSSNHESIDAAGGDLSVNVRASAASCTWTASSSVAWIAIVSGREGRGAGTVTFHVDAVAGPPRTASLNIAGQTVQVDQGMGCTYAIGADTFVVDAAGGDLSVNVRASAASCAWTASSSVPWISVVSGRDGRGDGTVRFHVDAVAGPPRTGTLTIAGQPVQVDQGMGCTYAIGADTFAVDAAGGERQVAVTAPAGCSWTAQSQVTWITITTGGTGSGSAVVVFRVAASDGPGRSGTLIVAGRTITVTQSLGCTYSITPSSLTVGAPAGSIAIQVDAAGGCVWTATSGVPWISVAGGASGSGRGQAQLAIAANEGTGRSGTITIAGRSLTITQASGCTYSVQPSSQDVAGGGGTVVVTITTGPGCTWTASSTVDWITVSSSTGGDVLQVTLTVKPNASAKRTGTVTVAGRTVTITQASMCRWLFAPESHDLPASGGSGNVLVFVTGGACSWTAVPNVSWIQITAGGSGTGGGLLQFIVPANPGAARTGTIAIGDENYVVRQPGGGD